MRVYELIASRIAAENVRAVFGLMGDGNLKLIPELHDRHGIAFYGARHEAGCVSMADGYARTAGEVGVCSFTQGPGLTNALTALISARRARTPMVVLCGDTPSAVPGLPQDIEQRPLLAAAGIEIQELTPENATAAVEAAFARARTGRCPVALNLPTDLQEQEGSAERAAPVVPAAPETADEAAIDAAVEALAASERPVVIAGRGALYADAREPLIALADRLGALLAHSLPLKEWFRDQPFSLGIAGGFASDAGRRLIGEADCVVVFGASLNHFTSRGGTLFADGTTIVQCDVDASAFGRFTRADVTVRGDAADAARRIAAKVSQRSGYRTAEVAAALAGARDVEDETDSDGLDPRALSAAIDAALPAERALVVDGGHFMGFPAMHMRTPDPSAFVCTLDFGSIGLGLAAAAGVAVASPDRLTVAAIGDGGLMMSLGELDTAVRYRLPLLVVVYNDGAYGAEMHFLRMLGLPDSATLFDVPPLEAVARSIGAEGISVQRLEDLDGLAERVAALDGPLLLDCRVTQNIRADWLEEAFERGTH